MSRDEEARRERAMRRRRKFKDNAKTRVKTDRIDWKKEGSVVILLHPESDIHERRRHWLWIEVTYDKVDKPTGQKRKVTEWIRVPFNCPADPETRQGCPVCDFRQRVKDDESIDSDTPVLRFGSGKDVKEFTKGSILGEDGSEYDRYPKDRDLYPKRDFVTCAVVGKTASGSEPSKVRPQVLEGPVSLNKAIDKCIDAEEADHGPEEGNPWFNPYGIRLTYDPAEPPTSKYDARAVSRFKISETVQAALDADPVDLKPEIELTGMVEKLQKIIDAANLLDVEEAAPPAAPARSGKSRAEVAKERRSAAARWPSAEPEPAAEVQPEHDPDVEDVPADEPKAAPRAQRPRRSKPAPQPEPEAEPETTEPEASGETFSCPACAGDVPIEADKCPHCDTDLNDLGSDELPF